MMNRRWTVSGLILLAVLAGVLAGTAAPAYAHAQLVGTTPANGARLDSAPAEIVLRFSERVLLVRDGVRLLDAAGAVSPTEPARIDPTGREVILPVPADGLRSGIYTVSWRVVSADSHPIHGAFVFGVGAIEVTPLPDAGAQVTADAGVTAVYWLLRWLGYAGLAGLAGGALFLFVCWPAGWAYRRARRFLLAAWLTSTLSALAMLAIQGPYAEGRGLGSIADPHLLTDTLGTDFGRYVGVRLGLLAVGGILLGQLARSAERPRWTLWVAGGLGAALSATWIGTGHANADASWPARVSDAVHLAAMAAWFGGLALLVGVLLSRTAGRPVAEVAAAASRFSGIATVCVALLVATGSYQAWRGVGSLDALAGSAYGRLLVFKLAAVGVLLWFGWMSRSVVRSRLRRTLSAVVAPPPLASAVMAGGPRRPSRSAGPPRSARRPDRIEQERQALARRQLRWSVRIEAAIGIAVLAVTALLVATPPGARPDAAEAAPPAQAVTQPDVASAEVRLAGGGRVYVQLDPARVGSATLTVTVLDDASKPWNVPEVAAKLSLEPQGIGPLPVPLRQVQPGDYTSDGLVLPTAGTWQAQITVRTSDIDQETVDATLRVY